MSLIPRVLPLPIHAPIQPDRYLCDPIYGQNIIPQVCQNIVDQHWPSGKAPVHAYLRDPSPSNAIKLPYTIREEGCTVSLELAGPDDDMTPPHIYKFSPQKLRASAGFVIEQCANQNGGLGGFVTDGLANAEAFVEYAYRLYNSPEELKRNSTDARPDHGNFITISITNTEKLAYQPGNTDPAIAAHLASHADGLSVLLEKFTKKWRDLISVALILRSRAITMARGGNRSWWDDSEPDDYDDYNPGVNYWNNGPDHPGDPGSGRDSGSNNEMESDNTNEGNVQGITGPGGGKMTYQCDARLGEGPDPVDCEKLSWSGLSPPDSVETLQANVPRFYSQGTCALGVSSPNTTTITWAHLLAAFDTLNNLCVQNPISTIKGGRAYYGPQAISSWINGRRIRRNSVAGINGSEALPPGINATVFRHDATRSLANEWVMVAGWKNGSDSEGD